MALVEKILRQKAVYWPPNEASDEYGKPVNYEPVEIRCRWEDLAEEVVDKMGRTLQSTARVYVDRELEEGGILRKGDLTTLDYLYEPMKNTRPNAYEIKKVNEMPDLKAVKFLRWVNL